VGGICPGAVKAEFAIGKGRSESRVAESGMPDPEDVWCGSSPCTRSSELRIIEVQMRSMAEALA